MPTRFLCLFQLCFCLVAAAQDVTVRPRLRAGDAFEIEVVHIREDSSRPQNNTRTRTPHTIKVVRAGETGYLLDWHPGAPEYADPAQAANPVVIAAASAVGDLHLMVELGPDGEYSGLENQAEVIQGLQKAVDVIAAEVISQTPQEQRAVLTNALKQLLQPEVLLTSATREVQMYVNMNAAELDLKDPLELALNQSNPLTGTAIPTVVRIELSSLTEQSAEIKQETVFDPAALKEMTLQLMKQAGATAVPEADIPSLVMSDAGTYRMDRATGLMQSVTIIREVIAGPQRRSDEWQMRLTKPPQR